MAQSPPFQRRRNRAIHGFPPGSRITWSRPRRRTGREASKSPDLEARGVGRSRLAGRSEGVAVRAPAGRGDDDAGGGGGTARGTDTGAVEEVFGREVDDNIRYISMKNVIEC